MRCRDSSEPVRSAEGQVQNPGSRREVCPRCDGMTAVRDRIPFLYRRLFYAELLPSRLRGGDHVRPHRLPDRYARLPSPAVGEDINEEQTATRFSLGRKGDRMDRQSIRTCIGNLDTEPARPPVKSDEQMEVAPGHPAMPNGIGGKLSDQQSDRARRLRHRRKPPLPQMPHGHPPGKPGASRRRRELPGENRSLRFRGSRIRSVRLRGPFCPLLRALVRRSLWFQHGVALPGGRSFTRPAECGIRDVPCSRIGRWP